MSYLKDMISSHKIQIVENIFDDKLQKKLVGRLNESIDIPFINEKMEAKGLNFLYDVFEEKIKDAFKKAL